MRRLRNIVNKTRRDRIRNQNVRDRMNDRKREWDSYISGTDDNRPVKVVRSEKPRGRRSVGRLMKRWKDSIV